MRASRVCNLARVVVYNGALELGESPSIASSRGKVIALDAAAGGISGGGDEELAGGNLGVVDPHKAHVGLHLGLGTLRNRGDRCGLGLLAKFPLVVRWRIGFTSVLIATVVVVLEIVMVVGRGRVMVRGRDGRVIESVVELLDGKGTSWVTVTVAAGPPLLETRSFSSTGRTITRIKRAHTTARIVQNFRLCTIWDLIRFESVFGTINPRRLGAEACEDPPAFPSKLVNSTEEPEEAMVIRFVRGESDFEY